MEIKPKVGVGVGVLLKRGDELLLLKRYGAHGAGTWCPPGGHIEFGETLEECARRETFEETNLTTSNLIFLGVTNDYFRDEGLHYVTVWFEGEPNDGEIVFDPKEATQAGWFTQDNLPNQVFLPLQNLLDGNIYLAIHPKRG